MTVRIIIADDHPIVRSGIRTELVRYPDLEVIEEALNGDEALQSAKQFNPEILLLDIHMPGKKAIDVVREIKKMNNGCHVLILSAFSDVPTVIGMLKAGVSGYILKDDDPAVIPEAIHAVLLGDTWLSPSLSDHLSSLGNFGESPDLNGLTHREREVLNGMASGQTNKEIALALDMSERTVEFHISSILKKLGARGRLDAVMKAKEIGFI